MQQQDEQVDSESTNAQFYERYAVSIFAYLRLHAPSWEDAEDILLEVFTAAFEQDITSG